MLDAAPLALPTSCAVDVDVCEDTGATDWDWLVIPAVVICVVVVAAMIWYAARGSRG